MRSFFCNFSAVHCDSRSFTESRVSGSLRFALPVFIMHYALRLGIPFVITNYFCGDKPIYAALNATRSTASTTSGVCLA